MLACCSEAKTHLARRVLTARIFGLARHRKDSARTFMTGGCSMPVPFRVHGPGCWWEAWGPHEDERGSKDSTPSPFLKGLQPGQIGPVYNLLPTHAHPAHTKYRPVPSTSIHVASDFCHCRVWWLPSAGQERRARRDDHPQLSAPVPSPSTQTPPEGSHPPAPTRAHTRPHCCLSLVVRAARRVLLLLLLLVPSSLQPSTRPRRS